MSRRFLISAGPTREFLDPVRYISNPSSGLMGVELARAASALGHSVVLVHGPCTVAIPTGPQIRSIPIVSALDMHHQILKHFARCDIVIMAAAVTDFRPRTVSSRKLKKGTHQRLVLELIRNPDILQELGLHRGRQTLVGFSAETHALARHAKEKLQRKNLDFIVANRVGGAKSAFGSKMNQAEVFGRHGFRRPFANMPKKSLAAKLIAMILGNPQR